MSQADILEMMTPDKAYIVEDFVKGLNISKQTVGANLKALVEHREIISILVRGANGRKLAYKLNLRKR